MGGSALLGPATLVPRLVRCWRIFTGHAPGDGASSVCWTNTRCLDAPCCPSSHHPGSGSQRQVEHELALAFQTGTTLLRSAKLTPPVVPVEDILAAAKQEAGGVPFVVRKGSRGATRGRCV